MQPIDLSEHNVVPFKDIAENIRGLRIIFVNVFGITAPDGSWTLVDAGLPMSADRIRHWVQQQFGKPPVAIVLTHGHFDHTGVVEALAREWHIPVFAHPLEAPFLTGRQQYPPPDPLAGGGIMPLFSPTFPRGPINISGHLELLRSDGGIPTLPEWQVIHTPGHTVGHISLFRESDRALLVGDAFCTCDQNSFLKVAVQEPELTGPPAYFTPDWATARDSVRVLSGLRPNILAPGHGLPMRGPEIPQKLEQLALDFDRIAVPEHLRKKEPAA